MKEETKSKVARILLRIGLILILLPITSFIISYVFSNLLNCQSEWAGENICSIGGAGIGNLLYNMYVFGFYIFYTLPIGLFIIILSGIISLIKKKK